MLRFVKLEIYGALDSRIRAALLKEGMLKKIYDGNTNSMVKGYCEFIDLLSSIKYELDARGIEKPSSSSSVNNAWRSADIEMALFRWAASV